MVYIGDVPLILIFISLRVRVTSYIHYRPINFSPIKKKEEKKRKAFLLGSDWLSWETLKYLINRNLKNSSVKKTKQIKIN